MTVIKIPFGVKTENAIRDYIITTFIQYAPNFGKILVITPSSITANLIKHAFIKNNVIMPKVLSVMDVSQKLLSVPSSVYKIKLMLFEIAKKHLPQFSHNSLLSFVNDFLEIEALIDKNKTDLIKALQNAEGIIENMALNLQASLVSFLKIFAEWKACKSKHNIKTKTEINLNAIDTLYMESFKEYDAIFLAYFQGASNSQIDFIKHVNTLPHGFIALNNNEHKLNNLTQNLLKELNAEPIEIGKNSINREYFVSSFANIPSAVNQLTLHLIKILQINPKAKVGFICNSLKTGEFLTKSLLNLGLEITTVFTEDFTKNPFFSLFILYLQSDNIFCRLSLVKHPFTVFAKEEALEFEKSLKKPNLNAEDGFDISEVSVNNFYDFLEVEVQKFSSLLTDESKTEKSFEDFINFIKEIKDETVEFEVQEKPLFVNILTHFASSYKIGVNNSENIFILTKEEARGLSFDFLFLTDLNEGNIPSPPNSNKIINNHIQKLLLIEENKEEGEWLDFVSLLYSSNVIYASYNQTNFEEEGELFKSSFLLRAFEYFDFKECGEVFYEDDNFKASKLNPVFNPHLITKLTPTSFEKLLTNPLEFYIKYILEIKEMGEITEDLPKNILGIIIHYGIAKFYKNGSIISATIKEMLYKTGYELDFLLNERAFAMLDKFFKEESQKKPKFAIAEQTITTTINVNEKDITLEAKPDRIEFYEDEVRIIDYKVYSGNIAESDVKQGAKPQLPFEGLIVSKLYPKFIGKIKLFYYYINLSDPKKVLEIKEIKMEDYKIVENSIKVLFTNLETFFYKDTEFSSCKYLVRNYE
jgi:hypothetical protein